MHQFHTLAHAPTSVADARHRLRAALEGADVGESVVYDATLVLSELVSNAVQHGRPLRGGSIEVGWSLDDDRLVLDVRDGGQGDPHAMPHDPEADRGRGLVIVGEICRDWHVEHAPVGTRVVAELVLAMA